MLRRVILLLAFATSALAYEEPRLYPERLVVKVGETATVNVHIVHVSGLDYMMWAYSFGSSDETVMETSGEFKHPRRRGEIRVEARAPGVANIMAAGKAWGRVEVVCGEEAPIAAVEPQHTIRRRESVQLSVVSPAAGSVLQWYDGRVGDTSQPLPATGSDYVFTSNVLGAHYVWVLATTPCSTSTAEFRVDVTQPRRRAVGR
jgi:hypothetical protein